MRRRIGALCLAYALFAAVGGASGAELVCPDLPPGIRRALDAPMPALSVVGGGRVVGGIVPHHDVAGEMIRRFYETLKARGENPRRVLLIGPDHFRAGRSAVTLCGADWRTPFGSLSADAAGAALLVETGLVLRDDRVFRGEHGMTNHLPLVRRYFPKATILPVIVRNGLSDLHLLALRKALLSWMHEDGTVLVLLSMDLSHYKPSAAAMREDDRTLSALRDLRLDDLRELDIDCPRGAALFLGLMREMSVTETFSLDHANSGELLGQPEMPCTSYVTMLFLR